MKKSVRYPRYLLVVLAIFPAVEVLIMFFTAFLPDFVCWVFQASSPIKASYYSILSLYRVPLNEDIYVTLACAALWFMPPTRRIIGRGLGDLGTVIAILGLRLAKDKYYVVAEYHTDIRKAINVN